MGKGTNKRKIRATNIQKRRGELTNRVEISCSNQRATMQRTKRRLTHSKHEPADSQPGKELGKEDINHLSAKYTVISYEHSNVRELNTQ